MNFEGYKRKEGDGWVRKGLIKGCTHVNLSRKKLFNLMWSENKIMKLRFKKGFSCKSQRVT